MSINIKEVQGFFFEMMLAGYASGKEPESFFRFPGHQGAKRISYQKAGGWNGTDEWEKTHPSKGSDGTTIIYKNGYPVWRMDYWGHYPKECLPFLRLALTKNYDEGKWLGGRGPHVFEDKHWFYSNSVLGKHDFHEFHGREFIADNMKNIEVGYHEYRGRSLI